MTRKSLPGRLTGQTASHWQRIYQTRSPAEVSWYQSFPQRSLELIEAAGLGPSDPILDVGGGDSPLVDHLLRNGYTDVTVLDIAPAALQHAQTRLGTAAARVKWIACDVTAFEPERRYVLWHDRAVFHFFVTASDRIRYLAVLARALARGGHLILATFGPQGHDRCSGLPVQRYSEDELSSMLGSDFQLRRWELHDHITPMGLPQQFLWGWWSVARS
jgi:SAM-dependent methyltransferase